MGEWEGEVCGYWTEGVGWDGWVEEGDGLNYQFKWTTIAYPWTDVGCRDGSGLGLFGPHVDTHFALFDENL